MLRNCSLLLFLLFTHLIAAQQVDWLKSWPVQYELNPGMPDQAIASSADDLVGMRLVNASHVYGQKVYGEVSMDRLDPISGELMLSCLLNDSVTIDAIHVHAGIGYFAGRFQGNALSICDGSTLAGSPDQPFTEHPFIIAWDLNTDEILWSRDISIEHGANFTITSLATDPQGDLWYSIEDFFTGKVIQVDQDGNDGEVRTIDGCKRIGAISFDPWGGLYVSGAADDNGNFTFAGMSPSIPAEFDYNMFVLRYRADGSAGFAEFANDITFQAPKVVATNDGNAYLACNIFDTLSWGGIPFNGPDWVNSAFLAKLDSTGQFLWGVESDPAGGTLTGDFGLAKGNSIAVDAFNNVHMLGDLRGSVDWGNDVISDGMTLGAHSLTIVAFSPDGIAQWSATSFPGSVIFSQGITAGTGAIHFASHITGEVIFGSETENTGGSQASMVGRIDGIATSFQDRTVNEIALWPVPASDLCFLLNNGSSKKVDLIDGTGAVVRELTIVNGINAIDLQTLRSGIYLLRDAAGNTARIVKE